MVASGDQVFMSLDADASAGSLAGGAVASDGGDGHMYDGEGGCRRKPAWDEEDIPWHERAARLFLMRTVSCEGSGCSARRRHPCVRYSALAR